MAAAKDFMKRLQKLDGVIDREYNPYAHVIQTPSPSVNFSFGHTHGLPRGYGVVIYGPPGGGKSLLVNGTVAQIHRDYPDGIVVKYDTEFREDGQLTRSQMERWGIDPDRFITYQTNEPKHIFDPISGEIAAMCQEGANVVAIIIDSVNSIRGRRSMNAESVDNMQIGDEALTIKDGLKQILAVQRKYRIGLIACCQVRAEMDQLEQKMGNKVKMAAAFPLQHHFEYFLYIDQIKGKDGRKDFTGQELVDASLKDMMDKSEQTGHRIRATMKKSSMGPRGRSGEFTVDYKTGFINIHEEVFQLGFKRGIIERVNNTTYAIGDREWKGGVKSILDAIKNDLDLQKHILKELRRRDLDGYFKASDEEAAKILGDVA